MNNIELKTAETERIEYIEPTALNKERNDDILFPYENYNMYVDLEIKTNSRDACGVYSSETFHAVLNLMAGSDGELTTNYTNSEQYDYASSNNTTECIGVESIDITYDKNFIPQVVIKFIDVRALSFFTIKETERYQKLKTGEEQNISTSFLEKLFILPPADFFLTVKGFYGKSIKYQLIVSDVKVAFNDETGNFEINAKFIGKLFGIYVDLPLAFISCAPYMSYFGAKYWKTKNNNGVYSLSPLSCEVPTFVEFRKKITALLSGEDPEEKANNAKKEDKCISWEKSLNDTRKNYEVFKETFDKVYSDDGCEVIYLEQMHTQDIVNLTNINPDVLSKDVSSKKLPFNIFAIGPDNKSDNESRNKQIGEKAKIIGENFNLLDFSLPELFKGDNISSEISVTIQEKDEMEYNDKKRFEELYNDYEPLGNGELEFPGIEEPDTAVEKRDNVIVVPVIESKKTYNTYVEQNKYYTFYIKGRKNSDGKLDYAIYEILPKEISLGQGVSKHFDGRKLTAEFKNSESEKINEAIKRLTANKKENEEFTLFIHAFNDNFFEKSLNESERNLKKEKEKLHEDRVKNSIIDPLKILGFLPTVENIFLMIFAHMETFIQSFYSMLDNIKQQEASGKRDMSFLKITNKNSDLMKESGNVPPFPGIFKLNNSNHADEYVLPGDKYEGNMTFDSSNFEEIKFVNSLYNAARLYSDEFQKAIEVPETGDSENPQNNGKKPGDLTLLSFPVSIYEFCSQGSLENPYLKLCSTEKDNINLFHKISAMLILRYMSLTQKMDDVEERVTIGDIDIKITEACIDYPSYYIKDHFVNTEAMNIYMALKKTRELEDIDKILENAQSFDNIFYQNLGKKKEFSTINIPADALDLPGDDYRVSGSHPWTTSGLINLFDEFGEYDWIKEGDLTFMPIYFNSFDEIGKIVEEGNLLENSLFNNAKFKAYKKGYREKVDIMNNFFISGKNIDVFYNTFEKISNNDLLRKIDPDIDELRVKLIQEQSLDKRNSFGVIKPAIKLKLINNLYEYIIELSSEDKIIQDPFGLKKSGRENKYKNDKQNYLVPIISIMALMGEDENSLKDEKILPFSSIFETSLFRNEVLRKDVAGTNLEFLIGAYLFLSSMPVYGGEVIFEEIYKNNKHYFNEYFKYTGTYRPKFSLLQEGAIWWREKYFKVFNKDPLVLNGFQKPNYDETFYISLYDFESNSYKLNPGNFIINFDDNEKVKYLKIDPYCPTSRKDKLIELFQEWATGGEFLELKSRLYDTLYGSSDDYNGEYVELNSPILSKYSMMNGNNLKFIYSMIGISAFKTRRKLLVGETLEDQSIILNSESNIQDVLRELIYNYYTVVDYNEGTNLSWYYDPMNIKDQTFSDVFLQLKKLINADKEEKEKSIDPLKEEKDRSIGQHVKLSMYLTLKRLYENHFCGEKRERWKKGTKESDFEHVIYIDQFYNDIGQKVLINAKTVADNLIGTIPTSSEGSKGNSKGINVYSFIGNILSKVGMSFQAFPMKNALADRKNMPETVREMFRPNFDINPEGSGNYFWCLYSSKPSEFLNIRDSEFSNDSFDIADSTGNISPTLPESFKLENGLGFKIPAFGVTFGKQNQSFFKNIHVNMDNFKETEYSIEAEMTVASEASKSVRETVFVGQDIYSVFSNYSYTCSVETMGNVQIMPGMLFQLNNIPMFKGAYMIMSVSHKIVPGDITTTFTGVRLKRRSLPINDFPIYYIDPSSGSLLVPGSNSGNGAVFRDPSDFIEKEIKMVIIDAGHGEETPGKRSPDGKFREYKYAREIAKMLSDKLTENGINSTNIIKDNKDTGINERASLANSICSVNGPEHCVFVSIHVNAFGNGVKEDGTEDWREGATGWSAWTYTWQDESDNFATCLYEAAEEILKPKGEKIIVNNSDKDPDCEGNFGVVRMVKCPAVLTENFFMTCHKDIEYLESEQGKKDIVDIHVNGIKKYIEKRKKKETV